MSGIFAGWTFYSRWAENRAYTQRLEEQKAAQAQAVIDAYGGDRLTILAFYVTPSTIRRGEKAQLCYGVSNSKSIRVEPPVKNIWPSFSNCVEVAPQRDTVYKLIAEDANGNTKTVSTAIKVR